MRRTISKVTHPRRTIVHAYERRAEQKPPPPPRSEAELRGGPIKRTYIRTRLRLSHFRHSFPEMPFMFQLVVTLVVGLALAGGGFAIYKATKSSPSKPNLLAAVGADAQTFYLDANANTKPGVTRVLLVGDLSVYYTAAAVGDDYTGGGVHAVSAISNGCGINDADTMIGNKRVRIGNDCNQWQTDYATVVSQYQPNVSVLMTGASEQFDQVVRGHRLRAGSAPWRAYLTQQLDKARAVLTQGGAKLVLVGLPCDRPPAGTITRADINALYRSYAQSHAPNVAYADLSTVMCPNGHPAATRKHQPLLAPGDQLTSAGIFVFWYWLSHLTHSLAGHVK